MKDAAQIVNATNSSSELQALLDAAVDGIIVTDHLGRIQTFNKAAERLFGYEAREIIGRNVNKLLTDRIRQSPDEHVAQHIQSQTQQVIGKGREVMAKRKDGTIFPGLLAVGEIPHPHPPRFVGFIHDNTEQLEAEVDAHRLQERLMHVSRLATVGEMASGIAHELNQPLAAIATYAHACDRLLEAAHPDIEEVQGALKQIAGQAVRAGDIIRKLRSLAKHEQTHRIPADVNSVVTELNEVIEADARAHGVGYRRDLQMNLPHVVLDRSQIQQVVMNLVHNALESLALAQIEVKELVIRTRSTAAGDVEISVCDNGVGVEHSIAPRMFDPFCSTKPAGTGLGLPISQTIVSAHDGVLEYSPNEPRGACFTVRFPATEPVPA